MKTTIHITFFGFSFEIGWFKGNEHEFALLQVFAYKEDKKVYIELLKVSKFLISIQFKYWYD